MEYNHPKDVGLINNAIKQGGIKTYLIDEQAYPDAFKKCSMRFVADASIDALRHLLESYGFQVLCHTDYIRAVGPHSQSSVFVDSLACISKEHIGEELIKALQDGWANQWLWSLKDTKLLSIFFPELADTVTLEGGPYHNETVFEHLMRTLKAANSYSTRVKLACLLHDIGKPAAYKSFISDEGKVVTTFHNHEILGATIAFNMCKRLKLHPDTTRYVTKMVRHHMFHFTEESTEKSIRKWLFKLGKEDWEDIFLIRMADRQGNKANQGKPVITRELKELRKKVDKIVNDSTVVFKEDLVFPITEKHPLVIKNNLDPDTVASAIIGLVNQDPERNNYKWIRLYIDRVYA